MATALKYLSSHDGRGISALTALLFIALLTMPFTALAKQVGEYHIKAVFLCNLTPFVNWPASTQLENESFVIGIYGPDPFKSILDKVVSGEKKDKKQVEVERYTQFSELDPRKINILFIHSSKMDDWQDIQQHISGFPILTVADVAGFPEQGGMVNLLKTGKKIQVEINLNAAQQAGLSMSSKLLSLARIVE